nr:hypothetical protein [Tanacetum cinerariifolium]
MLQRKTQDLLEDKAQDLLEDKTQSSEAKRNAVLNKSEESANEIDDADESDMDLSNDKSHEDAAARIEEKYTTSITKHYAARYYKEGIEDRILKRWSKEVRRYHFKALNGIDQRIPLTMTATHKGVVYLNQYNIKSLMKLSEVKKFSGGTLVKIQENMIDMLSKNKLGSSNKRLKGRDWTDCDVKSSREMLKKIDEVLRHREQLRRLEEYVIR